MIGWGDEAPTADFASGKTPHRWIVADCYGSSDWWTTDSDRAVTEDCPKTARK